MRYFLKALAIFVSCVALPLAGQPTINDQGITNAASYSIIRSPGGGLAPGSIMVIFGAGLGPATLQAAASYPLPTELAGTRVQIGNASAYLVYTSATQVAAVVPSTVQPGTHPVTVTYQSQTSQAVPAPVIAAEFGIFTRNAAGYGQAAAQTVLLPSGEVRTLGLATSAHPGEPIVLYGTGLGAIAGAPDDRPPGVARSGMPVQVIIGGKVVAPDYAGRSPNYAGLDQINFTVPANLTPGCYVAVAVRANGRLSNVASVPVTLAGRTCTHPFGLSDEAAARLDAGGRIVVAVAGGERRSENGGFSAEGAGIAFAEVDTNSLEIAVDATNEPYESLEPGSCSVVSSADNRAIVMRPTASRPRVMDAGAAVRLNGPSYSADLPHVGAAYGMDLPIGTLRPGTWTFTGAGGSEIGPFEIAAELPEPLTWSDRRELVERSQPLRIEWTKGGSSHVDVLVNAGTQTSSVTVRCTERSEAGGLTIPVAMLSMLPAGGPGGVALKQSVQKTGYTVPLTRGGTVNGSLFRVDYETSGTIRVQ